MARTHTVVAGETLRKIAQQIYGDAGLFRFIASVNGIANPDRIKVGQVLTLPDLPTSKPALQPFFAHATEELGAQGAAGGVLGTVPEGKLLIIEDVTVDLGISRGSRVEFFIETFRPDQISDPNETRRYPVPFTQRHDGSPRDILIGGRTVRWYIPSKSKVAYLVIGPTGAEGTVLVTVSGNFVESP
jgi:LysM repeat protein